MSCDSISGVIIAALAFPYSPPASNITPGWTNLVSLVGLASLRLSLVCILIFMTRRNSLILQTTTKQTTRRIHDIKRDSKNVKCLTFGTFIVVGDPLLPGVCLSITSRCVTCPSQTLRHCLLKAGPECFWFPLIAEMKCNSASPAMAVWKSRRWPWCC